MIPVIIDLRFLALLILLAPNLGWTGFHSGPHRDYWEYHAKMNEVENHISDERFGDALNLLDEIVGTYDFVFLRAYKIGAQLALHLGEQDKAFLYIKEGIGAGWDLKSLENEPYLSRLKREPEWKAMEQAYPALHDQYLQRLDPAVRKEVREMFKRDQRKAMGALLRMGDKAREKYAHEKFAPQSEEHMMRLIEMLDNPGYPGEKLIGNNFWASTILSHHNSISQDYVQRDTLYRHVRPLLLRSLGTGQMSPYEFALAEDWQIAVSSNRSAPGYGYLDPPRQSTLDETNELRKKIGLRTVELRNELIEVENKTGMDFHLPDWIEGKIEIE